MSARYFPCLALTAALLTCATAPAQQAQPDAGASPAQPAAAQPDATQLLRQIQQLIEKQQELQRQIEELQHQLEELKAQQAAAPSTERPTEPTIEELLNPELPQESESPQSAVTVGAQSFNPDIAVVGDFAANLGDRSERLGLPRHDTVNRHIELA
ncbi:MAG: hypothetical protein H5T86_10485, partial [Armatimonadetes bacterium]|nr:hypothetical protein [Armatimonadota bacterium]